MSRFHRKPRLPRSTLSERKHFLEAEPLLKEVRPYYVVCRACDTKKMLSKRMRYDVWPYLRHRKVIHGDVGGEWKKSYGDERWRAQPTNTDNLNLNEPINQHRESRDPEPMPPQGSDSEQADPSTQRQETPSISCQSSSFYVLFCIIPCSLLLILVTATATPSSSFNSGNEFFKGGFKAPAGAKSASFAHFVL